MRRAGQLRRGRSLARGGRVRAYSARREAERELERAFRTAVIARARGRCERCARRAHPDDLEAHHIVTRARGRGWPGLHLPSNGAALCQPCHTEVHTATPPDLHQWLRSRPQVDSPC